jgi:ATP adenylyltransferase
VDEFIAGGAGVPDEWSRIWTPHRMAYLKGEGRPTGQGADEGCPFCQIPSMTDEEGLIVARAESAYVVLNLYPYNSGHLLVCTLRHVADFTDMTPAESADFVALTQQSMRVLRKVSNAQGFNLGMNQGSVAGAGIAGHIHQHVVPRWGGDANFMPIIGRTKPMPALLAETRQLLADNWETA